jgi:hypothetical protein
LKVSISSALDGDRIGDLMLQDSPGPGCPVYFYF